MKIDFKYFTKKDFAWKKLEITAEEYFDLEEGEECTTESITQHLNLHQYLNIPLEELLFIHVITENSDSKRELKQTFWDNGNNSVIERLDSGSKSFKEIIITLLRENKEEIIRMASIESQVIPLYHALFTDLGEAESEEKLDLELYRNLYKKEVGKKNHP